VFPASRLVEWYTGHPDLPPSLRVTFNDWTKVKNVVIIGNGNVALDAARMLLLPSSRLIKGGDMARNSDMPTSVMEALSKSAIETVHVVGRRGAPQAKFTTKELRELLAMDNVHWKVKTGHGEYTPFGKEKRKGIERARRRLLELLDKHYSLSNSSITTNKNLRLHFLSSPLEISDRDAIFTAMEYPTGADTLSAAASVVKSKTVPPLKLPADRVFLAIGYTAAPLPGFEDWNIAFSQQRGVIRNFEGRVVDGNGIVIEGLYVSGWLKRGAEGVIAATWADAMETGEIVASDLSLGLRNPNKVGVAAVKNVLAARGLRTVRWEDWKTIDTEELRRGENTERGKEREKILERNEFWKVLDNS
jgi:NADPH-dependent glutamate synthase beta subunit-like oxidoreductase